MKTAFSYLLTALLIAATLVPAFSQSAEDILRKSEENRLGDRSYSEVRMTIVRPSWTREITMKSWDADRAYSLIYITGPARDKGIVYLKREKEVWNWVPSIERNIKLPPSMMSQSWMNSDFTNDDLVREFSIVKDYNSKILGSEEISGLSCYKIEMIPKPEAAVVWGKVIMWVDKADYLQMRSEFYDEDDYLVNTMEASNIKVFDGRKIPSYLEMVPVEEEGHKTILEFLSMDFDVKISDDFFTTQNMKRVR
jgi:outer membrane lipoprotein-sorting protein